MSFIQRTQSLMIYSRSNLKLSVSLFCKTESNKFAYLPIRELNHIRDWKITTQFLKNTTRNKICLRAECEKNGFRKASKIDVSASKQRKH